VASSVWQKFDDHCHRASPLLRQGTVMNAQTNTTDQHEESTYALLIRSEEKSRNALEVAIYPLLILGPLIAIWQLAQQPINIPPAGLDTGGCIACVDEIQALRQIRHLEIKG
jgi:hypothetical protein